MYLRVGGVNLSVNSKTSNLPPVIPQTFDWSFALCSLWKQSFFLATCRCMETFREEKLLWLSDNKFHNDDQCKIGLESGQKHWLLDREVTSFKLLLTNDRQKTKWHKECKRHEYITKQSIFVEYYYSLEEAFEFCRRSFADEHNNFNKNNWPGETYNWTNHFLFWTPWPPDLLCKHCLTSSAWNFCLWVADVDSRENFPSGGEWGETAVFADHSLYRGKFNPKEPHPFGICVKMLVSITSERILQFFPHTCSVYTTLTVHCSYCIFTVLLEHLRAVEEACMFMPTLPDYLGVSYM